MECPPHIYMYVHDEKGLAVFERTCETCAVEVSDAIAHLCMLWHRASLTSTAFHQLLRWAINLPLTDIESQV